MPRPFSPYTEEEDKVIREYYNRKGAKHCAELLGRTPPSVTQRAYRLGAKHGFRLSNSRWHSVLYLSSESTLVGFTKTELIQTIMILREELLNAKS